MAFRVREDELPAWRERLEREQVAIESEIAWPRGGRSIYFRDPAGNSIELRGTVRSKEQREKVREIANAFAVHSHVVDKLTIAAHDNGTDSK